MQRKRLVQPVSSNGRHADYELDYHPRSELLAQLVRSSRLVLTFRGFASFVVLLGLYLVVANTLQLVQLQAIEGDAQEMLPTTVHHVHPSLLGRRASADRRAGKLKTPPPPPEPPSPPPSLPPSPPPMGDGPGDEHCAALRAAAAEAERELGPERGRRAAHGGERVVVASSGWGLPVGHEQVSVRPRGSLHATPSAREGWSLLVDAASTNLRNPAIDIVLLFVPASPCALQLATETAAPQPAPVPAPAPAAPPGAAPPRHISRAEREAMAAAAKARSVPRLVVVASEAEPSWAGMAEAAQQLLGRTAEHERGLLALSRADVAWRGAFGCISRAALHASATLLAPSCTVAPRCLPPPRHPQLTANWSESYAHCRTRSDATACVGQLDLCHKYNRAHHALLLASPVRPSLLKPLRRNATFGSEAAALAALARAEEVGPLLNPCVQLGAECGHCASFTDLQQAWRSGALPKSLAPATLHPPLAADGSCDTLAPLPPLAPPPPHASPPAAAARPTRGAPSTHHKRPAAALASPSHSPSLSPSLSHAHAPPRNTSRPAATLGSYSHMSSHSHSPSPSPSHAPPRNTSAPRSGSSRAHHKSHKGGNSSRPSPAHTASHAASLPSSSSAASPAASTAAHSLAPPRPHHHPHAAPSPPLTEAEATKLRNAQRARLLARSASASASAAASASTAASASHHASASSRDDAPAAAAGAAAASRAG